jgi:hypothetical protein
VRQFTIHLLIYSKKNLIKGAEMRHFMLINSLRNATI